MTNIAKLSFCNGVTVKSSGNLLPNMTVLSARGRDSFSLKQLNDLSAVSNLDVRCVLSRLSRKDILAFCENAEILGITRRATADIDENFLSLTPHLRGIAVYASGYDWIGLEALRRHEISLSILPDYSTLTVAEHTWGMILTMSRRLHLSDRVARAELPADISLRGWELAGKTLGVVGFGRIGHAVARMARGFSMNVMYCDRKRIISDLGIPAFYPEVLSNADVLVLACSYQRGSPPFFNSFAISRMKQGSYLINPVRKALVDHDTVLRAIRDKRLAGYAVDDHVFTEAQLSSVQEGRILQTGHTAWYSNEAIERGTQCFVENLIALAKNKPINVVI